MMATGDAATPLPVGVLSIGTELTRGTIHNTNATWLCSKLTRLGASVVAVVTVDDDPKAIQSAVRDLARRAALIVSTGGLGPTSDDLTAFSVAQLLKAPLRRDEESLRRIERGLERRGRHLTPSNAKQADIPEGASALQNAVGTAPGFVVTIDETCHAYFMPGVPREMEAMFDDFVELAVRARVGSVTSHLEQLRVFGLPESTINEKLASIEQQYDVTLTYRLAFPEVLVGTLAVRNTHQAAVAASNAAASEVEQRLGTYVYGRGETSLVSVVGSLLHARGWTLGLAESCTGGLAAELITQEAASHYFVGAVVCYADKVKRNVLRVAQHTLETRGAVSEATVEEMVTHVRDVLDCDVGLAFSGIAGPSGGSELKPVGLVHYGVCTPEGMHLRREVFTGDRQQIQRRAAFAGFDLLRSVLV